MGEVLVDSRDAGFGIGEKLVEASNCSIQDLIFWLIANYHGDHLMLHLHELTANA